jgi:hypothetical protein
MVHVHRLTLEEIPHMSKDYFQQHRFAMHDTVLFKIQLEICLTVFD